MAERLKAVILLTSHDRLGNTGRHTGFHWEELATPHVAFLGRGFDVEIASIAGGMAPADPASLPPPGERSWAIEQFLEDRVAMAKLRVTRHVEEVYPDAYSLFLLAGGPGALWDFATDPLLGALITRAWRGGAALGALGYGVAGLIGARAIDGRPLVAGRRIAAAADEEARAAGLEEVAPLFLESRLREVGAVVEADDPAAATAVVEDGRLVTGRSAAAEGVAEALVAAFAVSRAEAA